MWFNDGVGERGENEKKLDFMILATFLKYYLRFKYKEWLPRSRGTPVAREMPPLLVTSSPPINHMFRLLACSSRVVQCLIVQLKWYCCQFFPSFI